MGYRKNNRNTSGYSLVEIIVVIGVMSVLLTLIAGIFVSQSKIYGLENLKAEMQINNLNALYSISNEIKNATEVIQSISLNGLTYNSNSSSVVLKTSSIDQNDAFIENKYDYIVFNISAQNKLIMSTFADSSSKRKTGQKTLADYVKTITFTYNSTNFPDIDKVGINLTMERIFRTLPIQSSAQLSASTRN